MDKKRLNRQRKKFVSDLTDFVRQWAKDSNRKVRTDILSAFSSIPRHVFLPGEKKPYADKAIVTKTVKVKGREKAVSSSSDPGLMYTMLHLCNIKKGHRVLEIGTGTGYNAGIIGRIVGRSGEVITVECLRGEAEKAERALRELQLENIRVIAGDGARLPREVGEFDRIIVTVAVHKIPRCWLGALRVGGLALVPFGTQFTPLLLIKRTSGKAYEAGFVGHSWFMDPTGRLCDRSCNTWDWEACSNPKRQMRDIKPTASTKLDIDQWSFVEWLWYLEYIKGMKLDLFRYGEGIMVGTWRGKKAAAGISFYPDKGAHYRLHEWGSTGIANKFMKAFEEWKNIGRPGLRETTSSYRIRLLDKKDKGKADKGSRLIHAGDVILQIGIPAGSM